MKHLKYFESTSNIQIKQSAIEVFVSLMDKGFNIELDKSKLILYNTSWFTYSDVIDYIDNFIELYEDDFNIQGIIIDYCECPMKRYKLSELDYINRNVDINAVIIILKK